MNVPEVADYASAVAAEQARYANCLTVHNLPEIFHYWSARYLLPKFQQFGFDSATEMFLGCLQAQCDRTEAARFVSLGAGNCDLEIELCSRLLQSGRAGFTLECLDLNPAMLARGEAAADQAGVGQFLQFGEADLNSWTPAGSYHAVIANQSLHHIAKLEHVFDSVKQCLAPGGSFAISDMIGRNGHQRWPEALGVVNEFWRELPPSYRFNRQLGRYEETFQDWDCSTEEFEGIRSQDILPLLNERFHFSLFVPYGNAIDPFIDRSFGPNFDISSDWDRGFIDRVQQRDDQEIAAGYLKPTHALAVLGLDTERAHRFPGALSPAFCIRSVQPALAPAPAFEPYDWSNWPHDPAAEIRRICTRLTQMRSLMSPEARQVISTMDRELRARTAWASSLMAEVARIGAIAESRQAELDASNHWAQGLDVRIEQLERELADARNKLEVSQTELTRVLRNPFRYVISQLRHLRVMAQKWKRSGNPNYSAYNR